VPVWALAGVLEATTPKRNNTAEATFLIADGKFLFDAKPITKNGLFIPLILQNKLGTRQRQAVTPKTAPHRFDISISRTDPELTRFHVQTAMKTATLNGLAVPMDCARRNVSASSHGAVLSGTGKRRPFGCQKAWAKAQRRAADPDSLLAWRPPAFPEPVSARTGRKANR